jgi:type I restriction enzyme, S subunit
LDLSEIKHMGVSTPELERTRLRPDDLLIVEGHGNPEEIGRCAVWEGQINDCTHQNHLIRVRFAEKRVDPFFASTYLNSTSGREQVLRSGKTTSGLNTLSTGNVKAFKIYVPSFELQLRFRACLMQLRSVAGSASRHAGVVAKLTASLQSRAFRGEL